MPINAEIVFPPITDHGWASGLAGTQNSSTAEAPIGATRASGPMPEPFVSMSLRTAVTNSPTRAPATARMRSPRGTVFGCGTNARNHSKLCSSIIPVDEKVSRYDILFGSQSQRPRRTKPVKDHTPPLSKPISPRCPNSATRCGATSASPKTPCRPKASRRCNTCCSCTSRVFPGREWATVGELAERLQAKQHGVVALITRCEAGELVVRRTNAEDRRRVEVHLLPKAKRS
jgi:hypothetical protein